MWLPATLVRDAQTLTTATSTRGCLLPLVWPEVPEIVDVPEPTPGPGQQRYDVVQSAAIPDMWAAGLRTVDRPAARRTGLELPRPPGGEA